MKWRDFLEKIKGFNIQVKTEGPCCTIAGTVDGEKIHTTEFIESEDSYIDTQDVTRILKRFRIAEMFFHGHI